MKFRISDTFTDSLTKLTGPEQKAVKTTAFDLQLNPANPGMKFHRINKSKDANFWSIRVNADLRLILHKTDGSLLLCYVAHHDPAYQWAERRKIERHPRTGAAQLVEVRETIQEITVPKYVEAAEPAKTTRKSASAKKLFHSFKDEDLLRYGVPAEWLPDTRKATEDTLFELVEHLPREAAEALLELATGGKPKLPVEVGDSDDPFQHPDALRRFRVMTNVEELQQALEFPWDKWTIFLHPAQRELVAREFNGPTRVSGSAGTGKTVVALHRAVHSAQEDPDAEVLLTTYSEPLARALGIKRDRLIGHEPAIAKRIHVQAITDVAKDLYTREFGEPELISDAEARRRLQEAATVVGGHRFSRQFLWTEWTEIVDAWQLTNWDDYRDVNRLGRKTRIGEQQRSILWSIFERMRTSLRDDDLMTMSELFDRVTDHVRTGFASPFDFLVVDEAQDLGVPELRLLAALGESRPDALFFAGDLGQRIFQTPFSWKSLGVDVRGRSNTLRINYRTSHQIRLQADRLLPPELSDVDGNAESRRGTVSVFNGPAPMVICFNDFNAEASGIAKRIQQQISTGTRPDEIAVFVRSENELQRARRAVEKAAVPVVELDERVATVPGSVSIGTMHLAKGLEFRSVIVMACDDEIIPQQSRIETVSDDSDLEEVYNTERHLLYVACTRARDQLLITGVEPASEFLDDLYMRE